MQQDIINYPFDEIENDERERSSSYDRSSEEVFVDRPNTPDTGINYVNGHNLPGDDDDDDDDDDTEDDLTLDDEDELDEDEIDVEVDEDLDDEDLALDEDDDDDEDDV